MKEPGAPSTPQTEAGAPSSHPTAYLMPGHHVEGQGLWQEGRQRLWVGEGGLTPVLSSSWDRGAHRPWQLLSGSQCEKGLGVWETFPKASPLKGAALGG